MKKLKKFIADYSDELTGILIVAGVLFTGYLIVYVLTDTQKTSVNIISILGTMASFFGLAIAFIQIIALKHISEVTQQTIGQTKDKILLGISISDVTEAIKLIQEIDSFLGNEKFEIARLKLIDLREKLIQFKSSEEFKLIIQENRIKEIIDLLNNQINILYEIVFGGVEIKFDHAGITSKLQEIATHLTDFKNKIKYQTV